jgi:anthranilate/para-aminobenzoate synthase component I
MATAAIAKRTRRLFIDCSYKTQSILRTTILKSERRWLTERIRGMDPWEVARGLAHLPELVFLDSALARRGAVSTIAAQPDEIVEGETSADWHRLQGALNRRAGAPGLAAGYVEYEGSFRFGFYSNVLSFSHDDGSWSQAGDLAAMLAEPAQWDDSPILFEPEMPGDRYEAIVRRAQQYIAAGDIYQVNLARRFSAPWSGTLAQALAFYDRLRACSPAPYAALICTASRVIASSSPELFLEIRGREAITRPIKGTRARAMDTGADAAAARELQDSAKERAELVMITDLERNDLGQVCDYGTVEARELLKLETFPQVHHLVSTVAGRLRGDVDHTEALRACFPGGSITGAPKKRAREIIAELEPARRGVYTGAIGSFGFGGDSTLFNIAIRTVVLERGVERGTAAAAHFHTGAGIVADSIPRREWEETMWKAAGILRAAGGAR